jgi:hypothetical protein
MQGLQPLSSRSAPNSAHARPSSFLVAVVLVYAVALIVVPNGLGIEVASVLISPARAVLVVLLVLVAVRLRHKPRTSFPALLPWLGFLLATAISVAINPTSGAVARWLSLVLEGGGVWIAVWIACELPRDRVLLRNVILATTALIAFVSAALFIFGVQLDDPIKSVLGLPAHSYPRERFGRMRVEGSFGQPLLFAVWLLPASALALPAFLRGRSWAQVAGGTAWVAIVMAVFLTGSRTGLVGVLYLPAVFLYVRRARLAASVAGIIATVTAIAMLQVTFQSLPAPSPGGSALPSGVVSAEPAPSRAPNDGTLAGSGEHRLDAYVAGARAISERPFFGWGLLQAPSVLEHITGTRSFVDNSYLQIAIEAGLLGLGMFAWLIWSVLRLVWRPAPDATQFAQALGLVAFLGMGMLASFVAVTQLYAAFWMYAGLAAAEATSGHSSADER